MPKSVKIKYLYEDTDRHGNRRLYVQPPGRPRRRIRIRAEIGTPEFWQAYHAALEGSAPPAPAAPRTVRPDSLRQLCRAYYGSAEFKALAPSTQAVRCNLLNAICRSTLSGGTERGDLPYKLMEPRHVRAIRDAHAEKPDAANGRVKALRQLFAWAVAAERAEDNPARDVPLIRRATDGFHTWTIEEVRQFEAAHPIGTRARLALALLLYTGARRSDIVTFGRQMVRTEDGRRWLHFTPAKGRGRHAKPQAIPILPALERVIEATPSGHMTFLVTDFGKPFTAAGFGNRFRKWCDEAGLKHCSAHGLRKAGATIAAENGATEYELMAIFGWDSAKQAAVYTRRVNQRRLADRAMHLLMPEGEKSGEGEPPDDTGGDEEKQAE